MHPTFSPSPHIASPPARARRWLLPGLTTLALHLLVVLWVDGRMDLPPMSARVGPVVLPVNIGLASLSPAASVPPPPARRSPPRAAPPKAAAEQAPAQLLPPPEIAVTLPPPPEPELPAYWGMAADVAPVAVPSPASPQYVFQAPPSVSLRYDVEKVSLNGKNYSGNGSISWQTDGPRYTIEGNAGILFISAMSFTSSGSIDDSGIAPELYSEKRFRRPQTNTHFHRERNTISFSASQKSYPRRGGEQDRISVIWQLVAIARGDESVIHEGAELNIFVAGVRDAELWPIRVIGQEDIELGTGKTRAWHLVRTPKEGSYDQILDIWLAPQMEWYPVKLRYTESNGDYLDLSLTSLRKPPAQ